MELLREWSTTPVLDIRSFIDGLIFNMVIGNADAHGKNYAMLYRRGERRLAPFYDLVSTIAWPELSSRLAANALPTIAAVESQASYPRFGRSQRSVSATDMPLRRA